MPDAQTLAAEFKAKCLDILDKLASHEIGQVTITKRGRPVAVLIPPEDETAALRGLHGFMRGSLVIPPDCDLTAPLADETADETFNAADSELHG